MLRHALLVAVIALLVPTTAFAASASRKLAQTDPPRQVCGQAPANSTEAPPGALLYVSVKATGTLTFGCNATGVPIYRDTQETATAVNTDEGYTGNLFMNKDGFMQLDIGLPLDTPGQFANNSIIFDKTGATFAPSADDSKLPLGRWSILSTDGDSPDQGGIPKLAYARRYDTGDAKVPKSCPAGQRSAPQPYYATYNFYTCDKEFTALIPAPGPSILARPPVLAPVLAPIIARPPIVLPPALVPAMIPKPAPMPAPMPTLAPIVVPSPVIMVSPTAVVPAAAPPSAAVTARVGMALGAVALPFML